MRRSILYSIISAALTPLFALATPSTLAATNSPPNKDSLIKKGAILDSHSDYDSAINVFSQAITEFPNNSQLHYRRGLSYMHNSQYPNAIKDLSKSIELNGENQDAHTIRGLAYLDLKSYDKAIADLDWVLLTDPNFKEALEKKAFCLGKLGQYQQAKLVRDQASRLKPRKWIAEGEPVNVNYGPYMTALQHQIRSHWHPEREGNARRAIAVFQVYRDGSITNIKLLKSCGSNFDDEFALKCIKATRLAKMPPGSPGQVDIVFTFDYKTFFAKNQTVQKLLQDASALLKTNDLDKASNIFRSRLKNMNDSQQAQVSTDIAFYFFSKASNAEITPETKLRYLRQALYYQPKNEIYCDAINGKIEDSGINPKSADERTRFANQLRTSKDLIGAIVEYQASLNLRDDEVVRKKLEETKGALSSL